MHICTPDFTYSFQLAVRNLFISTCKCRLVVAMVSNQSSASLSALHKLIITISVLASNPDHYCQVCHFKYLVLLSSMK